MTPVERLAYKLFHNAADWQLPHHPRLALRLDRAAMPQGPKVYLCYLDLIAALALLEGVFVAGFVTYALPAAGLRLPLALAALAAFLALMLPGLVYAVGLFWPELRASERAAAQNVLLPGALNYMAAMASSGMTLDRILASLSRQQVYAEVAEEARRISTESRLMGRDLLGVLQEAIPRTASSRLQDVLQGIHSTVASGASLRTYLLAKAEQMHRDAKTEQRRAIEGLGILAESFLVVAVAGPVFLILMLTVMGAMGQGAAASRTILWVLVLLVLPVVQGVFAFSVRNVKGRV